METVGQTQRLELEKGREYKIKLYSSDKVVDAKYLGCGEFMNCDFEIFGNEKSIILTKRYWLEQNEDEVLSYNPVSSLCTDEIPREIANEVGLGELLKELGEEI